MYINARTIDDGTLIEGDICIIGAGAAGISMALEWIDTPYKVILLEGGGFEYEDKIQELYDGKTTGLIAEKINEAYVQNGAKRLISFLDILNDLAESKEYKLLSSIGYKTAALGTDVQRLNKVINYLMENFQQPITLDQVAAHAYMSPTSFCRYFKGHTNKTLVRFLNELRVGYARKLLMENETNISEIHYTCGFQNASNFYEQFKKIVGCSPLQFRKQHEAKL